jgi:hypothetical protein
MNADSAPKRVLNKTVSFNAISSHGLTRVQCETCGRSFARNEHLIRHRRTREYSKKARKDFRLLTILVADTSERPFQCPHCKIGFPRSDVKEKHMKRFHTTTDSTFDSQLSPTGTHSKPRKERSKLACNECRRKKLKCDNSHPCETCRARNLPCTISSASRPPGRPRAGQTDLPKHGFIQEIAPALSGLPQSTTLMVQDEFEAHNASISHTRLDDSPSHPVLLVNDVSVADFNLSRDQDANDLSMDDPNSITVDAMEAAFPNEAVLIDDSWNYPQFLDDFDWQLPTLVSLLYAGSCSITLISSLRGWRTG